MNSATALLTVLFCAASMPAPAAIVYSGLRDIPVPATLDGVYLNIDTGATAASPSPGWDINLFFGGVALAGSAAFQPARAGTGNQDPVMRFEAGDPIVATLPYSTGETGSSTHLGAPGNFQEGLSGYLGFAFTPDAGGSPLHGWMRLTLTANNPGAFIHEWAWESTGGAIVAGQVPEPSVPVLAAAGLLPVLHRRRVRRRARR